MRLLEMLWRYDGTEDWEFHSRCAKVQGYHGRCHVYTCSLVVLF